MGLEGNGRGDLKLAVRCGIKDAPYTAILTSTELVTYGGSPWMFGDAIPEQIHDLPISLLDMRPVHVSRGPSRVSFAERLRLRHADCAMHSKMWGEGVAEVILKITNF